MDLLVGAVVLAGIIGAGLGAVAPLIAQLKLRTLRKPAESEIERLAGISNALANRYDRIRIIETVGEESVEVAIRGPPGYRVLFVTDTVVATFDDEIVRGLIAGEYGRSRVYYREYQAGMAAVVITLGIGTFAGLIAFNIGMIVLILGALLAFAVGRGLQYRADAIAADAVGTTTVISAFEYVADIRDITPARRSWRTVFDVQPPLGERIRRLNQRHPDDDE